MVSTIETTRVENYERHRVYVICQRLNLVTDWKQRKPAYIKISKLSTFTEIWNLIISILSDVILCYREKMLVSYLHSSTQINIMSPFVRFAFYSFSNHLVAVQFVTVFAHLFPAYGTQELYLPFPSPCSFMVSYYVVDVFCLSIKKTIFRFPFVG